MELTGMLWMNPPDAWSQEDGALVITPPADSDFFRDPQGKHNKANAPLFYGEVEGDFVATALVRPDFASMWNACALMAWQDEKHWAKLCFEWSDAGYRGVVSVVTREFSDDSNGVPVEREQLWLRLARKGSVYAMHYSLDGASYKMARIFALPQAPVVRVGMLAQCPAGPGAAQRFLSFELQRRTVDDLRAL